MKYHDSRADSRAKMQSAIHLLDTHQLAYTPVHYAVAYEYVSGDNPELTQLIDQYIAANTIDAYVFSSLYDAYIVNTATRDESNVYKLNDAMDNLATGCEATSLLLEHLDLAVNEAFAEQNAGRVKELVESLKQAQEHLNHWAKQAQQQASEIRQELESAKIEAITDPLTQLLNRQALTKMYHAHFSEASQGSLCAAMVDIDHFKKFNDDFGHLIGDVILRRIAKLLHEVMEVSGEVFRYGGEEFLILIPSCTLPQAIKVMEDIRQKVEKLRFVSAKTKERLPKLTISAGVTQFIDGEGLENGIARADEALYQAKRLGRNKVVDVA